MLNRYFNRDTDNGFTILRICKCLMEEDIRHTYLYYNLNGKEGTSI